MKKNILFLLMFLFAYHNSKAQVSVAYFPFNSWLSVSALNDKLFWMDYRIETNTFYSNMNMEFSPMVNIKRTETVNYYAGVGVDFNPFNSGDNTESIPMLNGYFITAGARIHPFKQAAGLNFIFELSPYRNREQTGTFRANLGIAYNFHCKKIKQ